MSLAPLWRRHGLWLAFLAVLAPLAILVFLQYRTLHRLQAVSREAYAAQLQNYLGSIIDDVRNYYVIRAERTLNIPASALPEGSIDDVAALWRGAELEGIQRLFLLDLRDLVDGEIHVFDPQTRTFTPSPDSAEVAVIRFALTRWATSQVLTERNSFSRMRIDESDPSHRLVINPIRDPDGKPLGVAGFILDQGYFQRVVLPTAVQRALPGYFTDAARSDLMIRIHDSSGNLIMGSRRIQVTGESIRAAFPFVFRDWTLEIQSATPATARLAQSNFVLLAWASLFIAVALAAALALTLRAAARTMQLSEMKSDFVSNVSHELRTPVASIRMFGELLRSGRAQSPEKVREYGGAIEAESRRLSDLIDNILDFSSIESGRKVYHPVTTDPEPFVEAIVDVFRTRLLDSGYEVIIEPIRGGTPPIHVDPDALTLALNNLLDNAVKYSGDSRRIFLRLETGPGSVVISVIDQGIGIPPGEQARIFERFHRVGTGSVHDVKGSGLGLSLVHHIMKAHHGRVTVESTPGKGSTFSLVFPAVSPEPVPGAVPERMTAHRAPVVEPDPRVERG